MPLRIKMRSVSVEDLGNIVKNMIDGALEDNDQVAKLRQAVFHEYYSRKMEELKKEKAKIDADCKMNEKTNPLTINESESKISTGKLYDFETAGDTKSDDINNPDAPSRHDSIDDFPPSEQFSFAKQPSSNNKQISEGKSNGNVNSEDNITKLSKSGTVLNSKNWSSEAASSFEIDRKLHSPVVHVTRRQKYVRVIEKDDIQDLGIRDSNIALSLANRNTSVNLTQTGNDLPSEKSRGNTELKTEEKVASNSEIIEWQSTWMRQETSKLYNPLEKMREIPIQYKSKGEIAFENWTKEKSDAYHRIFREEQKRKRTEQAARARQIEKKEAAREAYLYWRRQQEARQKLRNNRKRILAQMESQKLFEHSEKKRANSQAFKIWKRQKDVKLRERRMYNMMAYSNQISPQEQPKPRNPGLQLIPAFNTWLDQLDCVLHQKYLRERRYLVRSFYCQPAYFGTAALCGR